MQTAEWKVTLRRLMKHKAAVWGAGLLFVLILIAVFAKFIAPYPPNVGDFLVTLQPPNAAHWLGTDEQGRDLLSRLIFGTQLSLVVGLISVAVGLVFGVTLGALAGYIGGWVDTVIMRVMDILLAFPAILLAVAIVFMLGPGLEKAVIAVGIVSVPSYARITRGSVLSVKEMDFVEAARATGAGRNRILLKHVLPNIFAPLLVRSTLGTSEAILETAALGFLGLGARLPTPEWGLMLSRGSAHISDAPYLVYFPGIAITLAVLAMNLLGDGLRDALDPRLRQ
ncbi:MAG TPA: ABC transporter permease [Symbiobacteriaceae bacterium]|jgi:ABC-type dipeptide/oligopeptide/nickel transport system permease subunit